MKYLYLNKLDFEKILYLRGNVCKKWKCYILHCLEQAPQYDSSWPCSCGWNPIVSCAISPESTGQTRTRSSWLPIHVCTSRTPRLRSLWTCSLDPWWRWVWRGWSRSSRRDMWRVAFVWARIGPVRSGRRSIEPRRSCGRFSGESRIWALRIVWMRRRL